VAVVQYIHTNNTENDTKQTIHKTTQKYREQHKKIYIEQHKVRKNVCCAPSLQVLPWHLPYNWF